MRRWCTDTVPVVRKVFFYQSLQCWESVTFWCGSGSPDPYLWLMDPDPTPDPTPDPIPDPTSFFIWFEGCKKKNFIFFSYNFSTGYHLQSKKSNFLRKNFLRPLFQSAQHIFEKREGSGSGFRSGAGSAPLTNESRSGSRRSKNMRLRNRIPNTGYK